MTIPLPDRQQTLDTIDASCARFIAALEDADPSAPAVGHWSVRDVAVHVMQIYELFPRLVAGQPSPVRELEEMAAVWDARVAADPEQDPKRVAARMREAVRAFAEGSHGWSDETTWHAGIKAPVSTLGTILIGEAELHGWDIAHAGKRPWKIPREAAVLAILGLVPLLPHFLDRDATQGLSATYRLKVRGGPDLYMRVAGGSLTTSARPPGPIDCTISADPSSYLLVGYGRIGRFGPIATGKIAAWGRKPWLGLRFGNLFTSV